MKIRKLKITPRKCAVIVFAVATVVAYYLLPFLIKTQEIVFLISIAFGVAMATTVTPMIYSVRHVFPARRKYKTRMVLGKSGFDRKIVSVS